MHLHYFFQPGVCIFLTLHMVLQLPAFEEDAHIFWRSWVWLAPQATQGGWAGTQTPRVLNNQLPARATLLTSPGVRLAFHPESASPSPPHHRVALTAPTPTSVRCTLPVCAGPCHMTRPAHPFLLRVWLTSHFRLVRCCRRHSLRHVFHRGGFFSREAKAHKVPPPRRSTRF